METLQNMLSFSIIVVLTISCSNTNGNSAPAEITNEIVLNNNDVHNWTSTNYPNAYPPENQTLSIKCDTGYNISITIEHLDLDGENGDSLIFKEGASSDEKVFTNTSSNIIYLSNSNNVSITFQVFGKNEMNKTGFSLSYRQVERIVTLPADLSNTISLKTPSEKNLIVYVAGKSQLEFSTSKVQTEFRSAVSEMAIDYCKSNEVPLAEEITVENVQIHYLSECSFTWPEHETCTKIYFSIPIHVLDNSTWNKDQLTTFHLNEMWNKLGNKYLEKYEMRIYDQPCGRSTFKWSIIILCGVTVLFAVVVYLLKMFAVTIPINYQLKKKNKVTNTLPGFIHNKTLTMNPYIYSQSTPPIFGNDNYIYKQWQPELTIPKHPVYSEMDSDEEIVFSNSDKTLRKHKDGIPKEFST